MESCTRYQDGRKFETFIGSHRIITDQPISEGGTDVGPTPPELLLASLGACAAHYAAEYLRARSLPRTGLEVQVTAQKELHPARLTSFRVNVSVPGLEERYQPGLLRSVKACLIRNTLTTTPVIGVDVRVTDQLSSPVFSSAK